MDRKFIERIEQNLAENSSLAAFSQQLQESSVEFVRQFVASLNQQEMLLGEKLFYAKQSDAAESLKYGVFLQWQNEMKSLLGEYTQAVQKLQQLFGSPAVLFNRDLRGFAVESTVSVAWGSISIPAGTHGMLTGNVNIVPKGISLDALREIAYDSSRLRHVLMHPEGFDVTHSEDASYWDVIGDLTGDYFLAAHLALQVYWDDISEREPETLNHPMYAPWLKISG